MFGRFRASLHILATGLALAGPAVAQVGTMGDASAFDAHGDPVLPNSGDPRDALTIWSAFATDPGLPGVAVIGQYANDPLVREITDGDEVTYEPVIGDLVGAEILVSAPLHRRVGLGLEFPVWLFAGGESAHGPVAGDLRVWVPVRVWDPGDEGPAFTLVPSLRLPTGADGPYLGSSGVGAGGQAAFGWRGGAFSLSTQAGAMWDEPTGDETWPGGVRADLGASFGWSIVDSLAVHAEARGSTAFLGGVPSAEGLVSVRGRPIGPLFWTVGVGHALTNGVGAATWRAYAGVGVPAGLWPGRPVAEEGTRFRVTDPDGHPIRGATVYVGGRTRGTTDAFGEVPLSGPWGRNPGITVAAPGYAPVAIDDLHAWGDAIVLPRLPVDVVLRVTGEAAGAEVALTGPSDAGAVEVGDGTWTWAVTPGDWVLTLQAPGAGVREYPIVVSPTRTEPIVVDAALAPSSGRRLEVHVEDPEGAPVEGAVIRIGDQVIGTTATGGAVALDVARAPITVEAPGYAAPAPVVVESGASDATVVVGWLPGSVRIRALGPDGAVTDALVLLQGPEPQPSVPLGSDGEALIRLRPGRWTALVSSPTLGAQERTFDVTDESDRIVSLVVVLQPMEYGDADLAITLFDRDGAPIDAASVSLDGRPMGQTTALGSMTLLDLAPGPRHVHVEAAHYESLDETVAMGEGRYVLERVLDWKPGTVQVTAVDPSGAPVDARIAFSGPAAVPSAALGPDGTETFVLSPGEWDVGVSSSAWGLQARRVIVPDGPGDRIRVDVRMLPPDGDGTLRLTVTDPEGAPLADVEALLDGRSLGLTSNGGQLTAGGLAEGPHDLRLSAPGYAPITDTVRVRAGAEASYQMAWAPGALRVVVLGPGGPVDALLGVSGPRTLPPMRVGADGTRIVPLDPGTWWVLASSPSFGAEEREVALPEEPGLTTVEFMLADVPEGLGVLLLRVRDTEGAPIGGVEVSVGRRAAGTTSPGGAWLSEPMAPGPLSIDLDPPHSHEHGHLDAVLADGSQERVAVLKWKTSRVVVEVVDPVGGPVAAAVWFEGPVTTTEADLQPGESASWDLRPGAWTAWADASGFGVVHESFVVESGDGPRTVRLVLAPPATALGTGSVDLSQPIRFDLDRAEVRPEALAVIAEVARILRDHPEILHLEIQGHTDDSGGRVYNLQLSERRAEAVRQALIDRGVEPERLDARGYGLSRPVTPNVDEEGRAENRRVEFVIVLRAGEAP